MLRLRAGNHWLRNNFEDALNDTLLALKILGVEVNRSPTRREANAMFELIKNEILAVGFDEILSIPRTTDKRIELAVTLLNDAGPFSHFLKSYPLIISPSKRYQCLLEPFIFSVRRCDWTDSKTLNLFMYVNLTKSHLDYTTSIAVSTVPTHGVHVRV